MLFPFSSSSFVQLTTVSLMMLSRSLCQAKTIELYGLNYTPRKGPDWAPDVEKCKTPAEISADLTTLSSITSRIRIYSLADCNQGRIILDIATELKLKLMLGLWVGSDAQVFTDERSILEDLLKSGKISAETVAGVGVGSEAIYRKEISAEASISNLKSIQTLLGQYNLQDSIPVSVVDITDIYDANPALLAAGDVITGNQFPFWERKSIDGAVEVLVTDIRETLARPEAKNQPFILTETGWSSGGAHKSASLASEANQVTYFQNFYCAVAIGQRAWGYYYFSGLDDAWRLAQDKDAESVEGHFGIFDGQRRMKSAFASLRFSCPKDTTETVYTMLPTGDPDFDTENGPGKVVGGGPDKDDDKLRDSTEPPEQEDNQAETSFGPFSCVTLGISSLALLCM